MASYAEPSLVVDEQAASGGTAGYGSTTDFVIWVALFINLDSIMTDRDHKCVQFLQNSTSSARKLQDSPSRLCGSKPGQGMRSPFQGHLVGKLCINCRTIHMHIYVYSYAYGNITQTYLRISSVQSSLVAVNPSFEVLAGPLFLVNHFMHLHALHLLRHPLDFHLSCPSRPSGELGASASLGVQHSCKAVRVHGHVDVSEAEL